MEYINGKRLSEELENLKWREILYEIGKNIGIIHKNNIVHGDLTTSNIILYNDKLYFIDFGLSYFSNRIEDFAVDLHLFKESFEARHWRLNDLTDFFEGYKNSFEKANQVLKRLEIVEKRGRYKSIT